MNIIISQTKERIDKISTVENLLKKFKNSKKIFDMPKFVIHICERFGCSDRIAKEYIKIAQSRL